MELKVWVDGIQRVVCGVSDTTTCQDVVYALAHATGQTGRFTLAEKWRNNERLLAPQEHPLKVLVKWGEHSSDVQFVLRRSKSEKKNVASPPGGGKRQHDFLHSFSPTNVASHASQLSPQQNKEIKKSLTFSGGHSADSPNSPSPKQDPPQWDRKGKEPRNKQDVPRATVRGIPQQHPRTSDHFSPSDSSPSKQKDRPLHPPSYDEAVTRSAWHPPSHIPSSAIYSDHDSPSSKRRHLAGPRLNQVGGQDSRSSPNRNKDEIQGPTDVRLTSLQSGYHSFYGSPPPPQENLLSDKLSSKSKKEEVQVTSPASIASKTSQSREDLLHDPQYRDLIRLVSLQREKLTNQNAELSQYDSEIVYWENRLQEQEERLSALEEELHRLEQTNSKQGEELSQLEELERAKQEERALCSRVSTARSQLQGCEAELLQQRHSLRQLADEVDGERRREERRQEKQEVEIEEAKEELKKQTDQIESQKNAIDEVEKDMQRLEADLKEKHKLVETLVDALRQENLKSLSMSITEDIQLLAEGSFHNRPGSTRRILGSPRQLENAVPTSKNPHGVWV